MPLNRHVNLAIARRMKMNKYIFIFTLYISLFASFQAQAGIKFDISHTANKVMETVSGWAEQAQKLIEESTTIQTMIAYGKGVQEMAKWVKEQKQMITDTINQTKNAVNDVKNTATSTVGDLTNEITNTAGDIGGAASGALGGAAEKAQLAEQLLSLKSEKTNLENEYNSAAEARKTEYEGKVKSYQENNASYQAMIEQDPSQKEALEEKIAANNKAISQLQADYEAQEDKEKAIYESQVADIDAKISEVQSAAEEASLSLASNAAQSLFGNKQSAAELNKTIANNFVPEKDQLTSENIKEVTDYRNKTKAQDVLRAYAVSLQYRANRGSDSEKADETASSVPMMEGSSSAIALDTQLKVENMKALLVYTRILIEELKMRTASDLASLNVYKVNNPDKDVTEFNLDDYKYKKPSFFSKENLSDLAKGAKEGMEAINDARQSGTLPW